MIYLKLLAGETAQSQKARYATYDSQDLAKHEQRKVVRRLRRAGILPQLQREIPLELADVTRSLLQSRLRRQQDRPQQEMEL